MQVVISNMWSVVNETHGYRMVAMCIIIKVHLNDFIDR